MSDRIRLAALVLALGVATASALPLASRQQTGTLAMSDDRRTVIGRNAQGWLGRGTRR